MFFICFGTFTATGRPVACILHCGDGPHCHCALRLDYVSPQTNDSVASNTRRSLDGLDLGYVDEYQQTAPGPGS